MCSSDLWVIPLPWIAIEFGWIVAEVGRQPWAVDGVLPTFLAASSLTVPQIWATIIGFTLLYGTMAVIEVRLMLHSISHGPESTAGDGHGHGPAPIAPETSPFQAVPAE